MNAQLPIEVDILLSTYNGGLFLEQQLDSLIAQSHSAWRLLIRDDGSTDNTMSMLMKYSRKEPRIQIIQVDEAHLGPCQSYAALMRQSTAPYCMFCDQDDIWISEKIETMLSEMRRAEKEAAQIPVLIVSDLIVVDEMSNILAPSFWESQGMNPHAGSRFSSIIIQNKYPGCSMLMNRALRELARDIPEQAVMHDWWVAIVASAFGHIGVINKPLIFYRQHQANTLGLPSKGSFSNFLQRIWRTISNRIISRNSMFLDTTQNNHDHPEMSVYQAFRAQYAHLLSKRQLAVLDSLIHYSLLGIIRHRIFYQSLQANIILLMRICATKIIWSDLYDKRAK